MGFPAATAIYTAVSILLVLGLALRVSILRRATRTGLGSAGIGALEQRVRAHGNAVEYLPLALLGLLLVELAAYPAWWVHALGATLVAARLLHAWGLSLSAGVSTGRMLGTLGTWLVMLLSAGSLLLRVVTG